MCEDALNFVRTNGMIDKILIKNSVSDGVDFDFSKVKINSIEVYDSKMIVLISHLENIM